MHLLAAQPGGFTDDEGIVDLDQSPADIVILSAADSQLAALANCAESLPEDYPGVRLANWMQLLKPAAFDLYQHKVIDHATVVVVSLLGGESYWQYAYERLLEWRQLSSEANPRYLILVPGDDSADQNLFSSSNVGLDKVKKVWTYLRQGGNENNQQLFYFLANVFFDKDYRWHDPQVLPRCLIYRPGYLQATYAEWQQHWQQTNPGAAVAVVLFYRSHLQSAEYADVR